MQWWYTMKLQKIRLFILKTPTSCRDYDFSMHRTDLSSSRSCTAFIRAQLNCHFLILWLTTIKKELAPIMPRNRKPVSGGQSLMTGCAFKWKLLWGYFQIYSTNSFLISRYHRYCKTLFPFIWRSRYIIPTLLYYSNPLKTRLYWQNTMFPDLECTKGIRCNKSTHRYKIILGIKYSNFIWEEQKQFTEFSKLLLADMKIAL